MNGLTEQEILVISKLTEAWNAFARLREKRTRDDDDFCDGIHRLQAQIALRVARRANPEVWA